MVFKFKEHPELLPGDTLFPSHYRYKWISVKKFTRWQMENIAKAAKAVENPCVCFVQHRNQWYVIGDGCGTKSQCVIFNEPQMAV